ncbi:MAG: VanZ family protein [Gemmatimonadetes bacterium]|nr:VanZ family protein [Gemmatimonadota bacterium]
MALDRSHIRWFRILLGLLVIVISYLAFTPLHHPIVERIWDKLNHAAAFGVLAFATDFSFPDRKYGRSKILALLAYGVAIELIQKMLPYRDFELRDVVADAAGLLLYGLMPPILRRIPALRERWIA